MTNIKDRVLYVAEIKGVNREIFFEELGMSYSNFKGIQKKSALSSDSIDKILTKYSDIDANWIITGKGDILKKESNNLPVEIHTFDGVIPKNAKPFWNLPVSAGHSFMEIMGTNQPDGFVYNLPNIGATENLLPVVGYSMDPEVKENSVIGVRKIDNWETLNTTKKYLIITKDERMIKYIEHDEKNDDILWCISPNFKRFKIYKTDIIEIQRVTFVINPE